MSLVRYGVVGMLAFALSSVAPPVAVSGTVVGLMVVDEASGSISNLTKSRQIPNPALRGFVEQLQDGLSRHGITARLGVSGGLRVTRIPMVSSGEKIIAVGTAPASTGPAPSAGACQVTSPWADVTVSQDGRRIDGAVFWNERQVMQDRANLRGTIQVGAAPQASLPRSVFERHARTYAAQVIGNPDPASDRILLAKGIPADLLTLFRSASQSTRGRFSNGADGAMRKAAAELAPYYADLAVSLIRACLDGRTDALNVNSIDEATQYLRMNKPEY